MVLKSVMFSKGFLGSCPLRSMQSLSARNPASLPTSIQSFTAFSHSICDNNFNFLTSHTQSNNSIQTHPLPQGVLLDISFIVKPAAPCGSSLRTYGHERGSCKICDVQKIQDTRIQYREPFCRQMGPYQTLRAHLCGPNLR